MLDGKKHLIDPEMKIFGSKEEIEERYAELGPEFPRHVAEKEINIIWRRKRKN